MACDPNTLLADAGCWLTLNPFQLQSIILRLLCAIRDGETVSCDPNTLMAEAACIQSCMTPQMILAAQAKLLCDLSAALANKLSCGVVDPTADPGVSCAFYYNRVNPVAVTGWAWNDAAGNWMQII